MNEAFHDGETVNFVDPAALLENARERFEALWRSGQRPRLEDFVAQLPASHRDQGFRELLAIELAYRRKLHESIAAGDYLSRFPQWAEVFNNLSEIVQRQPTRLGDYELLDVIGSGGMGVVYRARHVRLDRIVAVKVLPDRLLNHKQLLARFRHEMQSIGRLHHPNIVQALDAREENGVHVLVMEYIDGISLDKLAAVGALQIPDACEMVRQAAHGLQHAFEQGLVHRDIKPSNLILDDTGTVKIVDFGLARLSEDRMTAGLTKSHQTLGTLDFMAPEQFDDPSRVDVRADIYSLGCTLFNLLSGAPPYPAPQYSSFASKMRAHCHGAPPKIEELRAEVPAPLSNMVQKMLAKRPEDRFGSPNEVAGGLKEFSEGSCLGSLLGHKAAPSKEPWVDVSSLTSTFGPSSSTETNPSHSTSAATAATASSQQPVSRRRKLAIFGAPIGVAILAAVALVVSRSGSSPIPHPRVSLAQVFGTLPGLTGQWWFSESPWLTPEVRQRWLPYFEENQPLPQPRPSEFTERLAKLSNLANDADVYEFQRRLKLMATDRLPDASIDEAESLSEITEVCGLLEPSENEKADYGRLQKVRERLINKSHGETTLTAETDFERLSAADCHLLALVSYQLALHSNGAVTPATKELTTKSPAPSAEAKLDVRGQLWFQCEHAFRHALDKYKLEKNSALRALCYSDLAQMYYSLGDYESAYSNFHVAQVSAPAVKSPFFEAYVLCRQADANAHLLKYAASRECLLQAQEIADDLPDNHPLRATFWSARRGIAWIAITRTQRVATRRCGSSIGRLKFASRTPNKIRAPTARRFTTGMAKRWHFSIAVSSTKMQPH